jgi:hypothetical protein
MSTAAQIEANQANAQLSTGPTSPDGKSKSARNRLYHGLSGDTVLMPGEEPDEFLTLFNSLMSEYKATSQTESLLVEKMAQHYWMAQRAVRLQNQLLCLAEGVSEVQKRLGLYLRYQTTHDRAFHKSLSDLLKLRKEAAQRGIGFESQKQKAAEEARKQELHDARVRALNAKAELTEIEAQVKGGVEAPLPGNTAIPFDVMRNIFRSVATEIHQEMTAAAARPTAEAA